MELLTYEMLTNAYKKTEKKKAIDYIITYRKAMGVYDSFPLSKAIFMSYVNEHLERQRYIKEHNVYFNVVLTKI